MTYSRSALLLISLLCCAIAGCYAARSQTPCPQPFEWKPLQEQVCTYGQPCSFKNPVTPGSLLLLPEIGACNGVTCMNVSDNQGDEWKTAIVVGQFNGIPLQYVSSARGGPTTVYFAPGTGWLAHIYEYPCPLTDSQGKPNTCELDSKDGKPSASWGSYTDDGLTPQGVEIQDNAARTRWIETSESCELLVSWALHGQGTPIAGPYFTMRQSSGGPYVFLGFEDSTTPKPGYFMASMSWTYADAWDEGVAAFKMGGTCK